jgi:hypothetical protein
MSVAFDLFLLMVSFNIPKAVKLSVRSGVAGCVWPNSVNVTLSGTPLWAFWTHAHTSDSSDEAKKLLTTDATLRIEIFKVSSFGGLSLQKNKSSRRLCVCETERYEASL